MQDLSKVIKDRIKNYDNIIRETETGYVVEVGDGIARIHGLDACMAGELIELDGGVMSMALNLEEDNVSVVILGDDTGIKEGSIAKRTGRVADVPVGDALLGRVVDALGNPIDGKGAINTTETRPVESPASGIIERKSVSVPLQTGIKAIDSMIPIGRGQRELIIGDRQTGKTAIAVDTIINQKDTDVLCIYVAIGQSVQRLRQSLIRLKRPVRWIIRLSFPQRRLKCRHFNILHRMQVVQWANILCIKARTF